MQGAAAVKYPWNKTEATPTLTGLPPHITILANFEKLKIDMERSKDIILKGAKKKLNKRCIGLQSHFDKEEILAWMLLLHRKLLKVVVGAQLLHFKILPLMMIIQTKFMSVPRKKLPVNHSPLFHQTELRSFTSSKQTVR